MPFFGFFELQVQREADCHVETVQRRFLEVDFGDLNHVVVQEVRESLQEPQVYGEIPVHEVAKFDNAAELDTFRGERVVL